MRVGKIIDKNGKKEYYICMLESEIKQNFSKNLSALRKEKKLTQADLAEKLNYSDKSISKWERGDVLPDVSTFTMIAEFFGVTVDELISADKQKEMSEKGKRILITSLSVAFVFFVATFAALFYSSFMNFEYVWLFYIYALPVSCILCIIFSSKWFGVVMSMVSVSGLVWSVGLSTYLTVLQFASANLWFIFVVCAVFQVVVFIWFRLVGRISQEQKEQKDGEKQ